MNWNCEKCDKPTIRNSIGNYPKTCWGCRNLRPPRPPRPPRIRPSRNCFHCKILLSSKYKYCEECNPKRRLRPEETLYYKRKEALKLKGIDIENIFQKAKKLYGRQFKIIFQGLDITRELVRIRDNHTCQECNKKWKEGQRRFDIHHLNGDCGIKTKKYDKIEDMPGLITLCHKCHMNLEEVRTKRLLGIRKNLCTI